MRNEVRGTDALIKRLQRAGVEGERMAAAIVHSTADQFVLEAKQLAPADLGQIRQNIGNEKLPNAKARVFANSPHSAYQEFGTGPMTSIPLAFSDLAARAKGRKGGNFDQFILSLTDWVRRKGMPASAAYPIARAILRRGLKPQPFFYPSYIQARRALPVKLKTALQRMLRNS